MHRAKLIRFLQEAARAGPSFFQITPLVPPCGEELLSATLDLNTVQLQNIGLGTSRKLNRQLQLRGIRRGLARTKRQLRELFPARPLLDPEFWPAGAEPPALVDRR